MNDEQLIEMSNTVDVTMANWCEDYDIDPLSMSAIVLARLTAFLDALGGNDDWRKILQVAIDTRSKHVYNSDMVTKH